MARKFLTGDKELEATLRKLADKEADKIARSALGAGLTALAKAEKKAAPVGKTGAVKASIGKRLERKKRSGVIVAKAGINVGKQTKKKQRTGRAPHSHLVALGTKQRTRKTIGGKFSYITKPTEKQLNTGVMPKNDFIKRAATGATGSVMSAMHKQATKSLARAAAKAAKK
jgi:hypothetical protein